MGNCTKTCMGTCDVAVQTQKLNKLGLLTPQQIEKIIEQNWFNVMGLQAETANKQECKEIVKNSY